MVLLVIDDDADVRAALYEVLARNGFEVRVAKDGADAFAALGRPPLPDAIILDLDMPYMTGWQFRDLQQRHAALAHIPVIVVTGRTPVQIDAAAVLKKPFGADELRRVLARVLGEDPPAARPQPQAATGSAGARREAPDSKRPLGAPLPRILP